MSIRKQHSTLRQTDVAGWTRPRLWSLALLMLCLAVLPGVQAQTALQSLSFADLPGDQLEVRLEFSDAVPASSGFVLQDPPRVAIDLSDTVSALGQRQFPLAARLADNLVLLETPQRLRLVFNLREPMNYSLQEDGRSLVLRLGSDAELASPARVVDTETAPAPVSTPTASSAPALQAVDFGRGAEAGEGLLTVQLAGAARAPRIDNRARRLELRFPAAAVPEPLNRRYDVRDFGSPVSIVDVLPQGGDALVLLDMEADYRFLSWQQGNTFYLSLSPPPSTAPGVDPAQAFSGQRVSLSFQDVSVRAVLQILAEENDLNLVVSDAVTGNVTLQLQNVPWDQALDLVLQSRNLNRRLVGNVMYVAPAADIAAQQRQALEASRQAEELEPLYTEYLQVNYADAADVLTLLTGSATGSSGESGTPRGVLSSRGTATVDQRTNITIVQDVASRLEEARQLLARLDVPVRQVLIEARIVNVSTDFGHDLGVRWGGAGRYDSAGHQWRWGGSLEATGEQTRPDASGRTTVTFPDALAVDLGVQRESASSFAIGFSRNSSLIELELSALESSGNGEVIARPRVTTQDKVTANIQSGVRIPYQAQAGGTAGGSTTEFVDAVLSLEVTPQITPDGRIVMQLLIHQDSVAAGSGQVPAINTNSVNTSVLVDNGDTVVLGGIFREETTTTQTRTPLLSDVPYLGRLFSRSSTASRRTELLIFITPRIVAELGQ